MKASGNQPVWKQVNQLSQRLMDWTLLASGIILPFTICWLTIDNRYRAIAWSLVLCFYFFFYRRIAQSLYWSSNTFRLLRTYHAIKDRLGQELRPESLPTFHILIAAYEASESIGPVIKAAANQDYPKEYYYIWTITEQSEQVKKDEQVKELVRRASNADFNQIEARSLNPFFWRCTSHEPTSLEAWITKVTSGSLQGYLNYPEIWSVVLEDLFSLLLRLKDRRAAYAAGILNPLRLSEKEVKIIERELQRIETKIEQISGDFARLLGSNDICDRAGLEVPFIRQAVSKGSLRRLGERLCRRFSDPQVQAVIPDLERIRDIANLINPSTQEVIRRISGALQHPHILHLDPHNRRFKPGALNIAYRQIKAKGLLENPESVYFIIIDADSLLPIHALKTIAREIQQEEDHHAIMQMASIPTANFFSGDWYSKFTSLADAIGAVGKWARSTRMQLKPDLQAGSGVVVPATLSSFIEKHAGLPWDERALTEDARLIIGQFGMMDSVRNKTAMAPVFLLEAVPADTSFLRTYQSFWNQRRRWSAGGYDELFYLLSSPRWLRYTRFNSCSSQWELYSPTITNRLGSRLRQIHRTTLWLWDHFIWGIGGFIVLTHWWLISLTLGAPSSPVRWLGLGMLLLSPLLFLGVAARHLSWFIPGGLSLRRVCLLYFQSFWGIWLYCLPAVIVQLVCIFGFRSKIVEWKPTQKPRYQFGRPLDIGERQ